MSEPASWECYDAACELNALCDPHALLHRKQGHGIGPLTYDGGPSADVLGAVAHCTKPDHSGPIGMLTHYCVTCKVPTCATCGVDVHCSAKHEVVPLAVAAAACAQELKTKKGDCDRIATRLDVVAVDIDSALQTADASLEAAIAKVEANADAVMRQVHAEKIKLIATLRALNAQQVSALHARLGVVLGVVPELRTLQAACNVAESTSSPMVQVCVSASVAASFTCFATPLEDITYPGAAVTALATPSASVGTITEPRLDLSSASTKCSLITDLAPPDSQGKECVVIAELQMAMSDGAPACVPAHVIKPEVWIVACPMGGAMGTMCGRSCAGCTRRERISYKVFWARLGVYAISVLQADLIRVGHGKLDVSCSVHGTASVGGRHCDPFRNECPATFAAELHDRCGMSVKDIRLGLNTARVIGVLEPHFTWLVASLDYYLDHDIAVTELCCCFLHAVTSSVVLAVPGDPDRLLTAVDACLKAVKQYATTPVIVAHVVSIFKKLAAVVAATGSVDAHCGIRLVSACVEMQSIVHDYARMACIAKPLVPLLSALSDSVRVIFFIHCVFLVLPRFFLKM